MDYRRVFFCGGEGCSWVGVKDGIWEGGSWGGFLLGGGGGGGGRRGRMEGGPFSTGKVEHGGAAVGAGEACHCFGGRCGCGVIVVDVVVVLVTDFLLFLIAAAAGLEVIEFEVSPRACAAF